LAVYRIKTTVLDLNPPPFNFDNNETGRWMKQDKVDLAFTQTFTVFDRRDHARIVNTPSATQLGRSAPVEKLLGTAGKYNAA
jgi:aminopeptidase C